MSLHECVVDLLVIKHVTNSRRINPPGNSETNTRHTYSQILKTAQALHTRVHAYPI